MAFKMKGFSYPGKAPKSPVKSTALVDAMGSMFGANKPETGSLMERMNMFGNNSWWKKNKMKKNSQESRAVMNNLRQERIKKDAYSLEENESGDTTEVAQEEKEQLEETLKEKV